MAWQPEDLSPQVDGATASFVTTFSRILAELVVYHNRERLPSSFFSEPNAKVILLTFVPLAGDTLFTTYLTDQTVDGRIQGSGTPPPAAVPFPEALIDLLDDLDNRIDALEASTVKFNEQDPKNSVKAASTANVAGTYDSTGGVMSTGAFSGMPNVIDLVTLLAGDEVLLKDQSPATQNGKWIVLSPGTGADGTWERSNDFNEDAKVSQGARMAVSEGLVNRETSWVMITQDPITVGGVSGSTMAFRKLSGTKIVVREKDGAPSAQPVEEIVVPNDTLTDLGGGSVELSFRQDVDYVGMFEGPTITTVQVPDGKWAWWYDTTNGKMFVVRNRAGALSKVESTT